MTDEYTPTTEDVREAASLNGGIAVEPDAFDRWLNEVKAEALREAAEVAATDNDALASWLDDYADRLAD